MIFGAKEEIIPKYYDDDKPYKRDGFLASLDDNALVIPLLVPFYFTPFSYVWQALFEKL